MNKSSRLTNPTCRGGAIIFRVAMTCIVFALALVAVRLPVAADADCDLSAGGLCVTITGVFPEAALIAEYQQPVVLPDYTLENNMLTPVTFTIAWAGIDFPGSQNFDPVTLDAGASESFSGQTFTIPDSLMEGTHQIAIGVTAQGSNGTFTVQRTIELVIIAVGKVREVIQVPVRWCAVEGSPQAQDKSPGDLVDATNLLKLLQQVNDEIWLPQAGILFRHVRAPFGIPVIKDDKLNHNRGDVNLPGDEWHTELVLCERAWAELATKYPEEYGEHPGIILVNATSIIGDALADGFTTFGGVAPAVPFELRVASAAATTGRRGDDLCGNPRGLEVSDVTPLLQAVVYDPANFMGPDTLSRYDEFFKPAKVLGHEIGHTLTLGHGNGLDDNGDGLQPPAPGRRRFDEYCDPLGFLDERLRWHSTEDATGFINCDASSSLMRSEACTNVQPLQREMARAAAKLVPGAIVTDPTVNRSGRLVALGAACEPNCATTPSLVLRTLELAATQASAVTSFSHSIVEPVQSGASNTYLTYADLDNDAATGCNIADAGLPAFQGAELRTEVMVSLTGGTVTATPRVWRCNSGAWVEQSDSAIDASYFVLHAEHTATPTGAIVTIRMPDAIRGPAASIVRLQALSQGGGQVDLLPASGAGQTVSLIPPTLPTCSVSPSIAQPGQVVVVTASSVPASQTATLFVGEESTGAAVSDAGGVLRTNLVVPSTAPQGLRPIEARFQGVSATCAVLVQGNTRTPVTTASLSPAPNWSGWNNTNVTVTLSAIDAPGGPGIRDITYSATGAQPIALTTHAGSCVQFIISLEGKTVVQFYATNQDGVAEALHTLDLSVDKTPPAITFTGNQQTYGILENVQINCSATDAVSGVQSSNCKGVQGPAYQFAPSGNTVVAEAIDFAGNVTNASTRFSLRVSYDDLCTLGQQFLAASTQTPGHANALGNSLCAHLSAARAAELRGQLKVKQQSIRVYVNEVTVHSRGFLSADQARILSTLARAL